MQRRSAAGRQIEIELCKRVDTRQRQGGDAANWLHLASQIPQAIRACDILKHEKPVQNPISKYAIQRETGAKHRSEVNTGDIVAFGIPSPQIKVY